MNRGQLFRTAAEAALAIPRIVVRSKRRSGNIIASRRNLASMRNCPVTVNSAAERQSSGINAALDN